MATYEISPLYKKSAVERTYYVKGDRVIIREDGWRWGTWYGDFDVLPDIDLTEDIDISSEEGWELDSLDDGCWTDWEFPDDMSEEEQQEILDAYDEDYDSGLEELGWDHDDYECWLQAPLRLELEDGTVITGNDEDNSVAAIETVALTEMVAVSATPSAAWPFPTTQTKT